MSEHFYREFDPFLDADQAQAMVKRCEDFGSYGLYSEEGLNEGIGEGLPQRFDAAFNFVRTGGRLGRKEDLYTLAARTNYFRETYAYGNEIFAPGIESFFRDSRLIEAAREVFGRPVIEPAIVYANILLPGQELAIHTDVPEFRGAGRKHFPQWLLVVMHHSALFETWRLPIATSVSWYHDSRGGEFAFYPDGADDGPRVHPVGFNSAVILDTDSVFHGVDRVLEKQGPMPPYASGMRLHAERDRGETQWIVRDGENEISRCLWSDLRFSVSWKAYCFESEAERDAWRANRDPLTIETALDALCADLKERGRLDGDRPPARELAELLVSEYVHFPPPAAA